MIDFSKRSKEPEIIDFPELVDQREIANALGELRSVNRWLGGFSACVSTLEPLVKDLVRQKGRQAAIRILDLGTGSADIPATLVQWGKKHDYRIRAIGLDFNFTACQIAKEQTAPVPEVGILQGDVRKLPVKPRSFEFVLCSAFLHHFSDDEVVEILRDCRAVTREAIVISDLHRHWFAYWSIRLLANLFSGSQAVKHDGPLSVLKAFRKRDLQQIAKKAGISNPAVQRHWAFRYVVVLPIKEQS